MIRNLDENWDWTFGNGKQDYAINQKAMELDILTNIKCWKNNCFYDLDRGIDWYNILGSFSSDKKLINQLVRVIEIKDINYSITPERKININIVLNTIYNNNFNINEIIEYYENKFKEIYGEDINLNSNTPDSQLINIFSQNQTDINETIINLYNSLNPNLAVGQALDNIATYHSIVRNGGSYTIVPIEIQVNTPLILKGLDDNYNELEASDVFTVSDNAGNEFYLINSVEFTESGTKTVQFRAKDIGVLQVGLETITNINTPQVGVVSVINNTQVATEGTDEESDLSLRNRFLNTNGNGGTGAFDNIISALLNVKGVIIATGENNNTNITSTAGTPAHSVWLIVEGGSNEDIAKAIYSTINAGCGMRGETSYTVYTKQGVATEIKWDRPSYEDLYIKFNITKKKSDTVVDLDFLKEQLINSLSLTLYTTVDINQVGCILRGIQNDLIYTDIKLSLDGTTWQDIVQNTNYNYIFQLEKANITITQN